MTADTTKLIDYRLEHLVKDFGPIYHETTPEAFQNTIVEPWNAFSSLVLVLPAILMLFILKGKLKKYPFIAYIGAPLLFLGGTGSTLYHAFRSNPFYLILDFAPIALLSLAITFYFLNKLLKRWYLTLAIILIFMVLRTFSFQIWEGNRQTAINISYFITGIMVGTPIIWFMIRSKFKHCKWFALALLLFAISLYFRSADDLNPPLLSMGTHWLWHIFSACGAFFIGTYIYKTYDIET